MNDTRVRIEESPYKDSKQVLIFKTKTPDSVGGLVAQFLDRWGMVAGEPDGEDSAGRQKLRLATPSELVTRAFDIAEEYMRVAEQRGHLVDVPDLNEINKEYDEKLRTKKEAEQTRQTA